MTVKKSQIEEYQGEANVVFAALEQSMTRPPNGYSYTQTLKDPSCRMLTTYLRHWAWPFIMKTPVVITVTPSSNEGSSLVEVSTQSQPFILADAFDFYGQYIRHILNELRHDLP